MQTITFRDGPAPMPHMAEVVTLWYDGDDGFVHRRNGRFHHRRNLPHIERCCNLIRQRNAANEEVRVDA